MERASDNLTQPQQYRAINESLQVLNGYDPQHVVDVVFSSVDDVDTLTQQIADWSRRFQAWDDYLQRARTNFGATVNKKAQLETAVQDVLLDLARLQARAIARLVTVAQR